MERMNYREPTHNRQLQADFDFSTGKYGTFCIYKMESEGGFRYATKAMPDVDNLWIAQTNLDEYAKKKGLKKASWI
jgi:hypothetical protein